MTPEGEPPPTSGAASPHWSPLAVPLLGVFMAGLLMEIGLAYHWPVAKLWTPTGDLDTSFTQISFPLAVYSVLYVGSLECAFATPRTIKRAMRSLAGLGLLFIIVILIFPYLIIGVLLVVGLIFLPPAAFLVIPLAAGLLYGAFLSLITARIRPHRIASHVVGGGIVGILVLHLYLLHDIGITFAAWEKGGSDAVSAGIENAILLTVCYVPHALMTRPWQAN